MSRTAVKRSNSEASGETTLKKRKTGHKKRAGVDTTANALSWKPVALPDRLDDWEGFVELEEIDDVEVVKDEDGKTTLRPRQGSNNIISAQDPVFDLNGEVRDNDDAESWSGFDDDDNATEPKPKSQSGSAKGLAAADSKAAAKEFKKKAKAGSKTAAKSGEGTAASSFKLLERDGDGDDADVSAWKSLKLSPDTLSSLARLRFLRPKPIQKAAIPKILAGRDVIGKASTGSGKTLAFAIPIFERFQELQSVSGNRTTKTPLALILSPTRELARQLETHISSLCSGLTSKSPVIATLVGGLALPKQRRLLKDADIVIGTPGRLWEVISEGQGVGASLQKIEFLVIDEADRLLSEGHFKEVDEILNTLERVDQDVEISTLEPESTQKPDAPHNRQTLVFSATFDRGLQKKLAGRVKSGSNLLTNKESMEYLLAKLNFREDTPAFIDVNPVNQMAAGLKESMVECGGTEKDLYTYALLLLHPHTRTLIFVNSISAVRRLTPFLQNLNIAAQALHSGMPQKARLRSIERFSQTTTTSTGGGGGGGGNGGPRTNACTVLVATDVAARGLDIPGVQLVLHYHLPRAADLYVHRSGRTARAGEKGSSILLCGPEEVAGVRRLVAKVHVQSGGGAAARTAAAPADADPDDDDKDADETSTAARQGFYIRTLDIDRRVVARLKPRATLAKTLADATLAKAKHASPADDVLRAGAADLGVEYDSEELEEGGGGGMGRRGRGAGRRKKERAAREMVGADLAAARAELRGLLAQRVNVGVSERYLASGAVDVDELLRQQDAGGGKTGEFLGAVDELHAV